eukprot:gene4308-5393_t
MGLISFLLDCVVLSTASAGVRRFIGPDISKLIVPKISNPTAKGVANGFFNVGEFVLDKSIKLTRSAVVNYKLGDSKFKDQFEKKNDKDKENRND